MNARGSAVLALGSADWPLRRSEPRCSFRVDRLGLAFGLACWVSLAASAGPIPLRNPSFEQPSTLFVSTIVEGWQTTPKPEWYEEGDGFLWEQLTGVFRNPAPGQPNRLLNVEGQQAVWLFAVPEAGLFQDLVDPEPPHTYAATFEEGVAYELTVAVAGGGGAMLEGVPIELGVYYLAPEGERPPVAALAVTNRYDLFPDQTWLLDFRVRVPPVRTGDPWAGRPIGVRLLSKADSQNQGGYWDLDHVRLVAVPPPRWVATALAGGQMQMTLESEPGRAFRILSSPDATLPATGWTPVGTLTNLTGRATFSAPVTGLSGEFFQAESVESE